VPSPRAVIVGCSRGMSADSVPWLTEQMRTSKPIASRRPWCTIVTSHPFQRETMRPTTSIHSGSSNTDAFREQSIRLSRDSASEAQTNATFHVSTCKSSVCAPLRPLARSRVDWGGREHAGVSNHTGEGSQSD
jgi:hypothetical protein